MTETISVFLTTAQKKKLGLGKTFQLSAHQIQAGSGKHNVEIQLSLKDYKKLVQNVGKNKGFRFTADKIVGSGLFGDIAKSVVKTVGKKVAKKVAEKGLDYIGEKTGQSGITNALKKSVDGLVDVGADRISGGKMKMQKGSVEMKEHMARLRGMRKGKGMTDSMVEGEGIFDDIKNGWNRTFNPKLGREIKKAFTSKPAREVYKGLANVGLKIGSSFTGLPLDIAGDEINRQIDGASIKRSNVMVRGGTLVRGVPQVQIRKGKGFNSVSGTHYGEGVHGGSFRSPTTGGSFASA
jgi:hypothetical protein